MANKVDLEFGGVIAATESTVASLWESYRTYATQYGFERVANGFMIQYDQQSNVVVAVSFRWKKTGILETTKNAFEDAWASFAAAHSIIRSDTVTHFYVA